MLFVIYVIVYLSVIYFTFRYYIDLSANSINENVAANSMVGTLSSTDADAGNTFTYSLVSGTGSIDNASFNISGSDLRIINSPDFETKSSYSVRVRTNDQGGLYTEKAFSITINNVTEIPTVNTQTVNNITAITATAGGNVTSDGGASISVRGVCWDTSSNPELGVNNFTTDGTGTGSFTSSISGLSAGTVYYVRAYATNSVGTNYGTQVKFTYTIEDKVLSEIANPEISDIAVGDTKSFTTNVAGTVNSVTVEPGGKVVLTNALTVNGNVTLKADDNSSFSATVGSGMAVSGVVRYVKTITKGKWYFISFPCEVAQSDITYAATGATLGNFGDGDAFDWDVEYYDGAARALNKQTDSRNWKTIGSGNPLEAYKGYIFWVNGSGTADIAFKLSNTLVLSEGQTSVHVAQCGTSNTIHDGWNLIGQPYLSKYAGGNADITYMTFPNADGGLTYTSVHKSENGNNGRIVDPFTAYFVQVAADGTIPFYTAGRQAAPAAVAAEVSDILQLNFTTPTGIDNTNLVMDNDQSTSYKIGEDMVKWLGTGTAKPQIYSILGGVNYAYNGLPITSVVNLPVGIYTQTAGFSTISVDATSAPSLSQLLLTDKTTGAVTNLLNSSYSFTATSGTNNTRFNITAQRIPTETIVENEAGCPTVLINNLELIINNLNGKTAIRVYDAVGRMLVSKTTCNGSVEIPLSVQGIYTVQMESGGNSWVRKVVCD